MPVPAKPFWLSQANTEFGGNGWASNILSKAGLSVPRYVGDLAGMSAFTILMNPREPVADPGDGMLYFWSSGGNAKQGKPWALKAEKVINFIMRSPTHCRDSIEYDERKKPLRNSW